MKSALRAGAKDKLANIRMLMAAIKQREVDERIELDDAQVLSVIDKMVKQRENPSRSSRRVDVATSSPGKPPRCNCCPPTCLRNCPPPSSMP